MSNYVATVVKLGPLKKHPNADRLQLASIFGNTVIVGLEQEEGDLGVFFPVETQLSEEYAVNNDLIRRKDVNGKQVGGFLEESRRIKALKLRGIPSMGMWLPIKSLDYISRKEVGDQYEEGDEFEKIGNHEICCKYVPKIKQTPGSGKGERGKKSRESRIIENQFRFHFDTAQLGKNIWRIASTDLISITCKLHGTSAIAANVLTKRKISLLGKIAKVLGVPVQESVYDAVYASRRVIKNEFIESKEHYYDEDLWSRVGKEHFGGKLHAGETVYYEIVGYTEQGSFIQKGYDYRCEVGKSRVYVYRITRTASDGTVVELQWNQVKARCAELGVAHMPEIYYGLAGDLFGGMEDPEQTLQLLKSLYVNDQDSEYCELKVPEEGICLRKDGLEPEIYKLKSFRFLEYETKQLDANIVDIETDDSSI
jgi:hypothetical protein